MIGRCKSNSCNSKQFVKLVSLIKSCYTKKAIRKLADGFITIVIW